MLLRQMRYFVAVVEADSFTEAAAQCFISQSAISQQMRALEQELGVPLFIRGNRRFSLTPAGEYFYSQCKPLLAQADALVRETRRLGEDNDLSLRIGYLRCYGGLELHQAIAEFSALYPEVHLSIENGTHEALYDLLRLGEVDLILSDQRRAFSDVYENLVLAQGSILVELSANHPLSNSDSVAQEALSALPCILIADKSQADNERSYYQNTLGFGPSFLFADKNRGSWSSAVAAICRWSRLAPCLRWPPASAACLSGKTAALSCAATAPSGARTAAPTTSKNSLPSSSAC